MWIDRDYEAVGDVGFLVRIVREGRETYRLRDTPPRTNQSHEPRLTGWCGETDNVSTFGEGMARVTATNVAGERMRVALLTGPELAAALEAAGYPGLE